MRAFRVEQLDKKGRWLQEEYFTSEALARTFFWKTMRAFRFSVNEGEKDSNCLLSMDIIPISRDGPPLHAQPVRVRLVGIEIREPAPAHAWRLQEQQWLSRFREAAKGDPLSGWVERFAEEIDRLQEEKNNLLSTVDKLREILSGYLPDEHPLQPFLKISAESPHSMDEGSKLNGAG